MDSLPDTHEPLKLADGTLIDPLTSSPVRSEQFIEVPTHTEAITRVVSARKRISDLPAPPEQCNTLSVILVYTLSGVTASDIALITGISETQVQNIRLTEAYKQLQEGIVSGITESDGEAVRNMLAEGSRRAAETIVNGLNHESMGVRMEAAKDILNRAGHRPNDIIEHRHKVEGGLTIEVVKRDANEDIPLIDITPETDDGYSS